MQTFVAFAKPKKSYIIGETAYHHEGDIKYLYRMVDDIAELQLDAVKFHLLLNQESYMRKDHPLMGKGKDWLFLEEEWVNTLKYSKEKGLDVVALCDDVESLEMISRRDLDVDAVEIHAVCLNDIFLLKKAAEFNRTVILGIGASTIDEIQYAIGFLKNNGKTDMLLMYGFQSYPTDYSQVNLSRMLEIKKLFNLPVGYADHTAFDNRDNEFISSMAAAMGFNILEKHYAPDIGAKRIDYQAAVGKKQIRNIRKLMDLALTMYGNADAKMSDSERKYGEIGPMKKAIVARRPIKKGEVLSIDSLWFKRTKEKSTIKQNQFMRLIGLEAIKNMEKDELVDFTKVKKSQKEQ